MRRVLAAWLAMPFSASAADFCTREPAVDPEFPAGLAGSYELIGKSPGGGAYAGRLDIAVGKANYVLTRTADGRTVKGSAWIVRCGADKIVQLAGRLETTPAPTDIGCALGNDGDNYYRVTCRTHAADNERGQGLEAWFQQH